VPLPAAVVEEAAAKSAAPAPAAPLGLPHDTHEKTAELLDWDEDVTGMVPAGHGILLGVGTHLNSVALHSSTP
jgi:hypothetical protein